VTDSIWQYGAKDKRHRGVLVEAAEGETFTTEKAISQCGLDWLVELRDPSTNDDDNIPADGWKQVVKVEEMDGARLYKTLGMVRKRYTPLLNRGAFKFFDRALLDGAASMIAAGHLDFGRVVYAVAKRPQTMELAPGDIVNEHLILTTSHDGSSAVKVMFAPYRTSTGTMLHVGQGRRMKSVVKVRHTKSIDVKMQTLHNVLAAETDYFDRWRAALVGDTTTGKQGFKQRVVTADEINRVVTTLFPARIKKDGEGNDYEEVSGRAQKARDLIMSRIAEQEKARKEAHEKAQQETPAKTTALDLFLGVSEYTAKDRKARNEGNNWVVSTFGSGQTLRDEAFNLISGL
jgi:uncharacterized protein DUF932